MREQGFDTYKDFYQWSITDRKAFWYSTLQALDIQLKVPYSTVLDDSDLENPLWLKDALINIVDSCFKAAPEATAIVYVKENRQGITRISYAELGKYINRIANALVSQGLQPGDAIGIDMSMNIEAVAYISGSHKSRYTSSYGSRQLYTQ